MNRIMIVVLLFTGLSWCFIGCYNDKEELLYPPGTGSCDTASASTFSGSVLPILNTNCNVCHAGTANAGGGINLDTYNGVKTQATNGKLMGAVRQLPGFISMPQSGGKLSDCNIAILQRWINAGMLNN
mgnify:CR=1 FL=1